METTKIIEINKLGRNVYFDSENHIKYVIMNNLKGVVDPTPQYPHLCAGSHETFSTNRFYDYLTNTWKEGNVDRYFGGILYETDYSGNIITDVVNQHITKNGHYLAKPYYAKDVMVQHRFDIDIPSVEKTVTLDEFGDFQITDEDGKFISKLNVSNKPKLEFYGIKLYWTNGTSSTFNKNDFAVKDTTSSIYTYRSELLLFEDGNNIRLYKNTNTSSPGGSPSVVAGSKYLKVGISTSSSPQNNPFVREMDLLFDSVYHEYDPVLGWVTKTIRFIVSSWIQSTITGPLYDMIWNSLFPARGNLIDFGRFTLDGIVGFIDYFDELVN